MKIFEIAIKTGLVLILSAGLMVGCASTGAKDDGPPVDLYKEAYTAYDNGDYKKAKKLFEDFAAKGEAEAQNNLGVMYALGKGVPQDYKKSIEWYKKSASQGYSEAQFTLGSMYDLGQGVPQNFDMATAWYRKAAETGNAEAQLYLGAMYALGRGVPKDFSQASNWYRKSAEQGNPTAQFSLGLMYAFNRGVPKDDIIALQWLHLASSRSEVGTQADQIMTIRDKIASRMSPEQITEAQRLAKDWKPKTR